jgi:hypothetical protein
MHVTYDKSENARVIADCKWIAIELDNRFVGGNGREACCESFAHIKHIANLGRVFGWNSSIPVNQYSVEVVEDFGFGRQYTYQVYKVGEYCEWKNITELHFNELLQHIHNN